MQYSYEFLKLEPKRLLAQVKYSSEGRVDITRNLIIEDFTEENVLAAVRQYGIAAVNTWNKIDEAPSSITLAGGTLVDEPTPPQPTLEPVYEDVPAYDPFVERLEESETITDTQVIYGYVKVALQGQEIVDALEAGTQRARLYKESLLSQTDHWLSSDTPAPTVAQLAYRQALRDVSEQPGFPITIAWPVLPVTTGEEVPASVTSRQCRLVLAAQGLLSSVESAISSSVEAVQIEWQFASTIERYSPIVVSLGGTLGLTEEQLDDMFKLAATL